MSRDDDEYALAARLSYADARRYLESRGWIRTRSRRSDIGVFRFGDHEAVLPMDTALSDYASAMMLFARRVAEAEGRSATLVVRDLAATNIDRHRLARVDAAVRPGVTLDAATAMIDGMSRALLAAACSTIKPQAFHPRMTLADAETFIADARFINTEIGSFVMVVDTPTEVDGANPGFGRAASTLLLRSIAHIVGAIRLGTPERVVNPEAGELQVSANLCEAILRMAPANEAADLRFGVNWSALIAPPANLLTPVTVDRHMYEVLEQIAIQMRPSASTAPTKYLGLVKELKGAPGPTGRTEGEVVFTLILEDGTTLRSRAQLDPDRYATAVRAHGMPSPVGVEGELHRVRRGYELRQVSAVALWSRQEPG